RGRRREPGQPDFHGARASRLAPQMALALQGGKLVLDTGGAGQADCPADLAHGRRITALLDPVVDEPENPSLPRGKRPVGAAAGRPACWRAAHPPLPPYSPIPGNDTRRQRSKAKACSRKKASLERTSQRLPHSARRGAAGPGAAGPGAAGPAAAGLSGRPALSRAVSRGRRYR